MAETLTVHPKDVATTGDKQQASILAREERAAWIKLLSLSFLVCQNSGIAMLMRYTRSVPDESRYLTSTVVLVGELVKLAFASLALVYSGWQPAEFCWKEWLKALVPSVLYVLSNNLAFVAISNLNAATYQLTYQGKILSTAVLSVLLLKKRLGFIQWSALLMLGCGIAMVQTGNAASNESTAVKSSEELKIGLGAAGLGCFLSSLANVYFEMILKDSRVSLWSRNVHLAVFGILSSLVGIWLSADQSRHVQTLGFFFGYTPLTWCTIMLGSAGGLLSAIVVKYADNILKGFATSFAIVLTCLCSVILFDFKLTYNLAFGGMLVNFSLYLYKQKP